MTEWQVCFVILWHNFCRFIFRCIHFWVRFFFFLFFIHFVHTRRTENWQSKWKKKEFFVERWCFCLSDCECLGTVSPSTSGYSIHSFRIQKQVSSHTCAEQSGNSKRYSVANKEPNKEEENTIYNKQVAFRKCLSRSRIGNAFVISYVRSHDAPIDDYERRVPK